MKRSYTEMQTTDLPPVVLLTWEEAEKKVAAEHQRVVHILYNEFLLALAEDKLLKERKGPLQRNVHFSSLDLKDYEDHDAAALEDAMALLLKDTRFRIEKKPYCMIYDVYVGDL
jgi:hypothetical protein